MSTRPGSARRARSARAVPDSGRPCQTQRRVGRHRPRTTSPSAVLPGQRPTGMTSPTRRLRPSVRLPDADRRCRSTTHCSPGPSSIRGSTRSRPACAALDLPATGAAAGPGRHRAAQRARVRARRSSARCAPGLVAVPVNPGYTARELRHVLADSGAAVLVGTERGRRVAGPGRPAGADTARRYTARAARPSPSCSHAAGAGRAGHAAARTWPCCSTRRAPPARPRARCSPTGRCSPTTASSAGSTRRSSPRRRGAAGAAALPRVRAQLRPRRGRLARRDCGVLVERFDPADTLDAIARHQRQRGRRRAADVSSPGRCCPTSPSSLASVRVAVSGAAPLDAAVAPPVPRGDPAPGLRGVRADRDRARGGDRAGQSGAQARLDRPADARASR